MKDHEEQLQRHEEALEAEKEAACSREQAELGTTTKFMELRASSDPQDLLTGDVRDGAYLPDYALFNVNKHRIVENWFGAGRTWPDERIGMVTPLRESQEIAKVGRTTGRTTGNISPVAIHVGGLPRFPDTVFALRGIVHSGEWLLTTGDSGGAVISLEDEDMTRDEAERSGLDFVGLCQGFGTSYGWKDPFRLAFFQDLTHIVRNANKTFGLDLEAYRG